MTLYGRLASSLVVSHILYFIFDGGGGDEDGGRVRTQPDGGEDRTVVTALRCEARGGALEMHAT